MWSIFKETCTHQGGEQQLIIEGVGVIKAKSHHAQAADGEEADLDILLLQKYVMQISYRGKADQQGDAAPHSSQEVEVVDLLKTAELVEAVATAPATANLHCLKYSTDYNVMIDVFTS